MGWGFRGSSHCGVWGWCSKRPGDRGQCRGTTTEHRSSPWAPHQPKLACNSGARTFCSTRKRCNSNDAISTFDIRAGELHATFLRKQHEVPQKPHAEDNSSPEDPHNPDSRHKRGGTTPDQGHYTRYGALHPIWGATPDMGRYTQTEEVHCLRIGCSAPTHKNKRGTDRTHLLPATTSPGASGGLIVPHGHCPTASVVQVARSDSCCALLILTPTATPQKPKPPQHNQGRQHPGSKPKGPQARQRDQGQQDSLSSQQAAAPPHHRGQPHPGSKPEASRGRAPRLLAGTTRPPRCTPWRPNAHTRWQ